MHGKQRGKGLSTLFTIPFRAAGNHGARARLCKGSGRAAMRVSSTSTNDALIAGDCFLILVQINPTTPASLRIVLPDSSEIDVQCGDGDVCLLAPGSAVTQRLKSCGELIVYQIPRHSIRTFADDHGVHLMDSLETPRLTSDPVLHLLSKVVRPLLGTDFSSSNPDSVAESFTRSFFSHLLECYGSNNSQAARCVGGLSPRHRRLVEEALSLPDQPRLGLNDLAKQCGLSTGHFARAFRQTFGVSLHKHLVNMRVQRAKQLLIETGMNLKEIAVTTGYADQATFTESFTRSVGIAPGRFRRRYTPIDGCDARVAHHQMETAKPQIDRKRKELDLSIEFSYRSALPQPTRCLDNTRCPGCRSSNQETGSKLARDDGFDPSHRRM